MGPLMQQFFFSSSNVIATACLGHTTHNCFVNYTHATGSITTVTTMRDSHGNHNSWLHIQLKF
jgi:hypothetical protein